MLKRTANETHRAHAQRSSPMPYNRASNVRLTRSPRIVSPRFFHWSRPDYAVRSSGSHRTRNGRLTSLLAYADACNQPIPERQLSIFQNATTYTYAREASSSDSEPALTKREVDNSRCLFGLPEVVEMRYQWTQFAQSTGLQPWPVILFILVAVLCFVENRRTKQAGKA